MNVKEAKEIVYKFENEDKALFNWCEDYKQFVENNVLACVSHEWGYMLNKSFEDPDSPVNYEDIDLFYYDIEEAKMYLIVEIQNDDDRTNKEKEELIKEIKNMEDIHELDYFAKNNQIEFYIEDYEREKEIYEYWLVSNRLKELLEEEGEIVLNGAWGRTTTGQSITLDYVMCMLYIKDLKKFISLMEE